MRSPIRLAAATLLAALLITGCDFADPYSTDAKDVATLLEDARYARAAGKPDRAIALLERAYELEPSHPVVRFELASTLMSRDGLSLLALERVTAHLLAATGASGAAAARPADGQTCSFPAGASIAPFDPRGVEDYAAISEARPTIQRVVELLNDPDAPSESPAMPDAFTGLDVCSAISPAGLQYDRAEVLAALDAQFETSQQVTGALTATSVALTLASYVALFEQPDLAVDWYVFDGQDIGLCVAEEAYDALIDRARAEVRRAGHALLALDLLVAHSGNDAYGAYVNDALALYAALETEETNPCAAFD